MPLFRRVEKMSVVFLILGLIAGIVFTAIPEDAKLDGIIKRGGTMKKIAIPMVSDRFSEHFGGSDSFAILEVDEEKKSIISQEKAAPPPHERGVFPVWLHDQGVNVVFAGGMGPRAHDILTRYGIQVVAGVQGETPEQLVQAYLDSTLQSSGSLCNEPGFHEDCGNH